MQVTMGKDWEYLWEGRARTIQGFMGFAFFLTSWFSFFFIFLFFFALKYYYKQLEEI